MSSILDSIFADKREELARTRVPLARIREQAEAAEPARDFVSALVRRNPAIIAEIKRASPSRGDIAPGLDPVAVARAYAEAGAAAISVLTDAHFKGSLDDLRAVRASVDLPLLRKDFVFDPYQVFEARAAGADCILLIIAMLETEQARTLLAQAEALSMAALVEVHNRGELEIARGIGARLIGINNRDLHTFRTDLAVTEELATDCRDSAVIVSESGIASPQDIRRLYRAGARAFLIGESLLVRGEPQANLAALAGAFRAEEGQGG